MILLPVATFLLAWRNNAWFRELILSIDTGLLVILHSWRMVGMGFLFLYAYGVLPGLFAWLAGAGIIVIIVRSIIVVVIVIVAV